jgi:predicted ABC-type ATPase
MQGGHDVPEAVVRRRFDRSIRNFLAYYRALADEWIFYDNSDLEPVIIASEEHGRLRIADIKRYNEVVARYGAT